MATSQYFNHEQFNYQSISRTKKKGASFAAAGQIKDIIKELRQNFQCASLNILLIIVTPCLDGEQRKREKGQEKSFHYYFCLVKILIGG
jgi:hypothetical protein